MIFIKINTNHLIYDDINKIAKNDKPFESVYNSHFYKGINLYLDLNNSNIKSKDAHFEIDLNKTKRKNSEKISNRNSVLFYTFICTK